MAKGKEQNNGLRMVLFYICCGIALVSASYGGLYFTFNNISSGIEKNDKASLESGINFRILEISIKTQMPENLAPVKVPTGGKYANSADVVSDAPRVEVNPDTFVSLVKKSGICAPAGAKDAYDPDACDMSLESMAYSHLNYKLVNKANKDIWVKFIIAKDKSIVIWHLMDATLSKAMMANVLD